MSQVDTRVGNKAGDTRAVELVDCDVHAQATEPMLATYLSAPARRMLERYGRRTPRVTEWYPRARNAGMRVDAWPDKPGHIWGSDPETEPDRRRARCPLPPPLLAGLPFRRVFRRLEGFSRNWTNVRLRELRRQVAFRHTGA